MSVKKSYNIDEDLLEEKAEESDYWSRARDFYNEVKDKDTSELTGAQLDWLQKIEDQCS